MAVFIKNGNLKYKQDATKFVWDKEKKISTTKQEDKLIDGQIIMKKFHENKYKNIVISKESFRL